MNNFELIDKLNYNKSLTHKDFLTLITTYTDKEKEYAASIAQKITIDNFGHNIFFRGIIEFSNYCKNNCLYCGIRNNNNCISRYRLTKQEILDCCEEAYGYGFRTFVLQSGEDYYYTTDILIDIIKSIKSQYNDCAITLSIGEKSRADYQQLYNAGADRYLLRHETATTKHYNQLHPHTMSFSNRFECLNILKEIGYQTGCGFMVGSPYQTANDIANDLIFIKDFQPHMVGIGPFIPHNQTPFKDFPAGSINLTLFLLSLLRIMIPKLMLPATTALETLNENGRQLGILSGCNVIMPNISPMSFRKKYMLYNNKVGSEDDTKTSIEKLTKQVNEINYNIVISKGDSQLYYF